MFPITKDDNHRSLNTFYPIENMLNFIDDEKLRDRKNS